MLILLLMVFLPAFLSAQGTGRINGYLHDKVTGEPLPYARVILRDTQFAATTDVHGYYVLNGIPPGEYKLIVSMTRYERVEKELEVPTDGEIRFDVEAAPEAIQLDEVEVTGEKTAIQRRCGNQSHKYQFPRDSQYTVIC